MPRLLIIIIYYLLGAKWVPTAEELQKPHTEGDSPYSLGAQSNVDVRAKVGSASLIIGNHYCPGTTKGRSELSITFLDMKTDEKGSLKFNYFQSARRGNLQLW